SPFSAVGGRCWCSRPNPTSVPYHYVRTPELNQVFTVVGAILAAENREGMNSRRGRREDRAVKKGQSLVTATEPCRPTPPRFSGSYLPLSKTVGIERPANVLLRRGDHSNDLIVHFLNQVSRLLDCDSAQD